MSKFTKGQWKYSEELYQVTAYPDSSIDWERDKWGIETYPDGSWWQDITGELCGSDEAEIHANGRLIASAPKMYWLLTEMLKIEALKAQAKTEDNSPLFMKALVAQDGADNIARKLIAYIDGTEEQS